MMPGRSGMEVLSLFKERYPSTEIIIATGYATLETAIEAMKNGAFDCIASPIASAISARSWKKRWSAVD